MKVYAKGKSWKFEGDPKWGGSPSGGHACSPRKFLNLSNLGARECHFLRYPRDILLSTKENANGYIFYPSPVLSLRYSDYGKRVKQWRHQGNYKQRARLSLYDSCMSASVLVSSTRNIKIRGRRRQRKRSWKSEFAFFQSSLRLVQVTIFVKCRRTLSKVEFLRTIFKFRKREEI